MAAPGLKSPLGSTPVLHISDGQGMIEFSFLEDYGNFLDSDICGGPKVRDDHHVSALG